MQAYPFKHDMYFWFIFKHHLLT